MRQHARRVWVEGEDRPRCSCHHEPMLPVGKSGSKGWRCSVKYLVLHNRYRRSERGRESARSYYSRIIRVGSADRLGIASTTEEAQAINAHLRSKSSAFRAQQREEYRNAGIG